MKTHCSRSPRPSKALLYLILAILPGLLSCNKEKPGPVYRVIGEAFAGPNQLPLRQDVTLRSPVITTVQHGERLEVLDRRRRFLQVRTKAQVIGWVDIRLLISAKQMDQLDELAKHYKNAPSMGRATVFDVLNVHTDPNRNSPTFLQIQEKEQFDVIGHRVVVRTPYQGETIEIEDLSPKPQVRKKRHKKEPAIPPPPPPPTPKLPDNWLDMSRSTVEAEPGKPVEAKPMDDLSLIRNKDGRVGWVVTNAIFLEVPDDVAQYAEGQRITSYFPMGEVSDDGKTYNHWLWTTQSQKYAPFEFDGIRLFTYNTRRHRYETAYRERNLRGFFPVLAKPNEFQVIVEDDSSKLWLKSYTFDGNRVKSLGKQPYKSPDNAPPVSNRSKPLPETDMSWFEKLMKLLPGRD
ncbi:MAG: SH3 domain-containing protein [Acidobacteria bacterium]|nr:SH3 domain-containing protein [Acidobacteriota bacterium]